MVQRPHWHRWSLRPHWRAWSKARREDPRMGMGANHPNGEDRRNSAHPNAEDRSNFVRQQPRQQAWPSPPPVDFDFYLHRRNLCCRHRSDFLRRTHRNAASEYRSTASAGVLAPSLMSLAGKVPKCRESPRPPQTDTDRDRLGNERVFIHTHTQPRAVPSPATFPHARQPPPVPLYPRSTRPRLNHLGRLDCENETLTQ